MNIILFDGKERDQLLPLTFTRPMGLLRWGILSISEKWEKDMGTHPSFRTVEYLQEKYPHQPSGLNLYVNGGLCPNPELIDALVDLEDGQALVANNSILGFMSTQSWIDSELPNGVEQLMFSGKFRLCSFPWQLFSENGEELEHDFDRLTKGRESAEISNSNTVLGGRIFLEPTASVEASILNATTGSIYIGDEASILEGCMIRGGLALAEHSQLKMGAKIYGATTLGPYCKAGGEINNSILFGYSNKGHDGFLGNSVLGEWCNLGADTNNSNLKNNYDEVKIWSYVEKRFIATGQQFCGLIMGDHSKSGINTMFNTGTVVGVSSNIFGSGFPRNYIPSFSWGGASGLIPYRFEKAMETAEKMMARRGIELDSVEMEILKKVQTLNGEGQPN
jgi:UDP-N-acetylglucosamine diphosphorylase/glucosamine-1-phosphate N-acetyltransferase